MQTHDFFTRIIAANSVGPNMIPAGGSCSSESPRKVYICGSCDTSHDSHTAAEECCPPEVYSEYQCPVCSETHGELRDAETCCGKASAQPIQCPVCLLKADSYEEAADCCLHTHPTMTAPGRWLTAAMVAQGMSWAEAVAANVNH